VSALGERRLPLSLAISLLILLGIWHLGLRRHGLQLPMISDEGEYSVEARLLRQGGLPYRDAYDQKPPLVFFLYRLAFAAFGERTSSARILAALFCWASLAALFFLVPAQWGNSARFAAAAGFAALSTEPVGDLGFAANTEVFLCAFLCLGALALRASWQSPRPRPRLLWAAGAGLAAGAALASKQTAFWPALVFLGFALWGQPEQRPEHPNGVGSGRTKPTHFGCLVRREPALAYVLGLLAVPSAFLVYFALRGGLREMIEQVFSRNMAYSALLSNPEGIRMQLDWLLRRMAPLLLRGEWPFWLLAFYGLAGVQARRSGREELLFTLWLAASWLGVLTGFFLFPHYFLQAAPPLVLCAAMGVRRVGLRSAKLAALAALFAALYPAAAWARIYFLDPPEAVARKLLYPNPLYESSLAADFIRSRSRPKDKIYVFGSEPQIYFLARRSCATRHIFVYPLTLFPRSMEEIDRELAALRREPPAFLVYSTLPSSKLTASEAGRRLEEGIRELASSRYRCLGFVQALESGSRVALGDSARAPEWSVPDALLVFQRKADALVE